MSKIASIIAREILDSRGNPTIETQITTDDGYSAVSSVPSGASTGHYETLELRDQDMDRYGGMGVLKAVANVNQEIAPQLIGYDPTKQQEIDKLLINLDGTPTKMRLGANAILSVSQGICEVSAASLQIPTYLYVKTLANNYGIPVSELSIPIPTFNLING